MLDRRALSLFLLCHVVSMVRAEDWRQSAEQTGLNSEQIEEIAQNKILTTGSRVFQVFSPYIEPRMPVFITSDSILNAYHVLFEESVLRLELANSARLPGILHLLWQNLETVDRRVRGDPRLVAAAKQRAQIVLGTAMKLLGDAIEEADAVTAGLIAQEVDRGTAAVGIHKPE